jgi:hypothetical protein
MQCTIDFVAGKPRFAYPNAGRISRTIIIASVPWDNGAAGYDLRDSETACPLLVPKTCEFMLGTDLSRRLFSLLAQCLSKNLLISSQ